MTAHAIGSPERPLRVAVVGSGPAGFYTAEALAKHKGIQADVDLIERLPSPHGLVRYGVAPDHQKIKSVIHAYDKLCENPKVRFLGNVRVAYGDISLEELLVHYDQVVFCVGCGTDRRLGVPGEDLAGSHSATSFVAWYNAHPDFHDYRADLAVSRAAVIGVGDVSLDIGRMLVRTPEELGKTDIAAHAMEVFRQNQVEEVLIFGRRGPAQAAFATKELEDIVDLPDVDVLVDAHQVTADLESGETFDGLAKRKLEYLASLSRREPKGAKKRIQFRFLTSPVEILGENGRVTGLRIEHNEIVHDAQGRASARGTGRFETIPLGLVFRAVGYRGVPLDGLPFDEKRGIVPNRDGRVLRGDAPWPGVYVAGWIKRGPSGVIGTNKADAVATVQKMVEDIQGRTEAPSERKSRTAVDALLARREVRVVTFQDWKKLDALERERGQKAGKVREKFATVKEFLDAVFG